MQASQKTFPNVLGLIPFALAGFAVLVLFELKPLAGLAALVGLAIVALCLKEPEWATFLVILVVYANIPAVIAEFHHVPKFVAASVAGLLVIPLYDHFITRREKIVVDRTFLLMSLFLVAMAASTVFSRSLMIAVRPMADFAFEGLVLYFLISNLIRDLPTLKYAMIAALLAGSQMGALSIFQRVTHTLNHIYGGFAQTGGVFGVGMSFGAVALQLRAEGPIGEQNRYAQVLIVLLPMAFWVFKGTKSRAAKVGAMAAGAAILGGMVLTVSRGAMLALFVVILVMTAMRYIKVYQVVLAGLLTVVAFFLSSPDFAKRLQSVEQIPALLSGKPAPGQAPDESMRRRLAENLAALEVFTDNPVLGVGPGHFTRFYSTPYVVRIGLAPQQKGYFAHNMYLQIAAETGAVGLLVFLCIPGALLYDLWMRWRRLRLAYPDLALLSVTFLLSCTAYLLTAVFLQLSYQRYFWLLLAFASSAVRVIDKEAAKREIIRESASPEMDYSGEVELE